MRAWGMWGRSGDLAVNSVDLVGLLNVSNDNLSFNNSHTRLNVSGMWGKDGSSDFGLNVDLSSERVDNVVKNLLLSVVDVVSSEGDITSSKDVENKLSVGVAVDEGPVSSVVEVSNI